MFAIWKQTLCGGVALVAAAGVTGSFLAEVSAECPCRQNGAIVGGYSAADAVLHPDALLRTHPQWSDAPPQFLPDARAGSTATGLGSTVNRHAVAPPPGTLGRTYQRRSTLMPDDKHPRMAAVDVYLPENVDVSARGLKSTWTGEVWRLESTEPLLPGVPHIYAIKAEKRGPDGKVTETDVRWVRLILGRIVDLEF